MSASGSSSYVDRLFDLTVARKKGDNGAQFAVNAPELHLRRVDSPITLVINGGLPVVYSTPEVLKTVDGADIGTVDLVNDAGTGSLELYWSRAVVPDGKSGGTLGALLALFSSAKDAVLGNLLVAFRPDLQTGVNKHLQVTLTAADTDYLVTLPDNARFVTMSSASGSFRYAFAEACAILAIKAGNAAAADFGVGGRVPAANIERTHIIPYGAAGRVLHLRATAAATVVDISIA